MRKDIEWLKSEVWDMNRNKGMAWKDEVMDLISQVEQSMTPILPKHVAEYLEFAKSDTTFDRVMYLVHTRVEWKKWEKVYDWIEKNIKKFVRAWFDGYTVEEKKYRVIIEASGNYLHMFRSVQNGRISVAMSSYCSATDSNKLTEKEIKKYDERFWAFAELVEEEE